MKITKDISMLSVLLIVLFALSIIFFFPKDSGLHGEVSLEDEHSCECMGFERTSKITGKFIYNTYCYGLSYSCDNVLECLPGESCWVRESGCRCQDTQYWAPSDYPCADDECLCTHEECGRGIIGG